MLQKKPLSLAVSAALGLGAIVLGAPSFAQEGAESIEEVVVTGSRIKRADLESASPVTVLSREDLKTTGITDVGDLIQSMPSMSGSPIGTTTNNGGDGSVQVDLRGLGTARTLTLINGRRTVDGGDYQTIPSAMIERVEILKDGASAVYGADAVAGVVNIITRKNFEGVELDAQSSDWSNTDGAKQQSLSAVFGKAFEGGHFVFGAEYVKQDEAFQSDTPWDFMQNTYYIYPEGCEKTPAAGYGSGGCYPIGSSRIEEGRLRFAADPAFGSTFMNEGNGLVPYDGRTYNYAPVNYLQTPYEKFNLFVEGGFDINEYVKAFAEVRGNLRESSQVLAPTPYDSATDPGYQGVWNGAPYTGISEQNYYLVEAVTAAGLPVRPVVNARRRMSERDRSFEQDVNQIQGVFGLTGDVKEMTWEVTYNRGYRTITYNDFGQYFGPNLANALGPSADLDGDGSPECYRDVTDPTSIIAGCVPMNLFGGPQSVTDDMFNYVQADLTDHLTVKQEIWEANISGSAFKLPGGDLGWSVGAFYWEQELNNSPDATKQLGQVTGNTGDSTQGTLENSAIYVELLAPVFDNGNQALDVKLGLRYDDYDAFGGDETWQIGLDFQVIKGLRLRGTAGTVFRSPTISDLYGGQQDSFPQFSDPCAVSGGETLPAGCAQESQQLDSQVLTRVGGNPDLQPETGDSFTAGVVWTPELSNGSLSVTVDYWDIQLDDAISTLGADYILEDCYVNGIASACALVTRDADYEVSLVEDFPVNAAEQAANGVDTEIRYTVGLDQFGLNEMGEIRASFLWARLLERTQTPFAGAEEVSYEGRYAGSAFAEDKINYSLTWAWNDLTISYLGEYISELDADTFCNCVTNPYIQKIDSMLYHDIVASYTFTTNTTVTAGLTNISDKAPPFIETGFNGTTDPSTYRMFGRGFYVRLNQKF